MGTSVYDSNYDVFVRPATDEVVDSDRIATMMDAIEKTEHLVGQSSDVTGTTAWALLNGVRQVGSIVNVWQHGVLPGNTAAANTTAIQSLCTLAVLGPIALYFPPGTYDLNPITVSYSSVSFIGQGTWNTVLNYKGSSAGAACISLTGVDGGRLSNCFIRDLTLNNAGNGDSIGVNVFAGTHHRFERVNWTGFRRNALKGVNFADSQLSNCEFEFCGSADDSNKAVIDFSDVGSTEWGVDEIKFINCRFENNSDRICTFTTGTLAVNKIRFIGGKFESSTLDTNGISGTVTQFLFTGCNDISFTGVDFTLQGLQSGTHAIVPSMFKMTGCNGVMWANCSFNVGSVGAYKPFTVFFDCDGSTNANYSLLWSTCAFTSGNAASVPTNTWKFTGTNRKIKRSASGWGYIAGGGASPADSGAVTTAADF